MIQQTHPLLIAGERRLRQAYTKAQSHIGSICSQTQSMGVYDAQGKAKISCAGSYIHDVQSCQTTYLDKLYCLGTHHNVSGDGQPGTS